MIIKTILYFCFYYKFYIILYYSDTNVTKTTKTILELVKKLHIPYFQKFKLESQDLIANSGIIFIILKYLLIF